MFCMEVYEVDKVESSSFNPVTSGGSLSGSSAVDEGAGAGGSSSSGSASDSYSWIEGEGRTGCFRACESDCMRDFKCCSLS